MRRYLIVTASGSLYNVSERDDGSWWLSGKNVRSFTSQAIPPESEWPIEKPDWPPVTGKPVMFVSLYFTDVHNPLRIPGGGKITSDVASCSELGLS